ncbi:Hypothetical protein POVR1_LOCUS171 [uncultured virus]|nr:Hypothetical protein POVR1_LOCUS171 [uncultured virus]
MDEPDIYPATTFLQDQVESGKITNDSLTFDLSHLDLNDYEAMQYLIRKGALRLSRQERQLNIAWLEQLPYDIFKELALRDELTANDLISLCKSSRILHSYCQQQNQKLFQDLIWRDYHG